MDLPPHKLMEPASPTDLERAESAIGASLPSGLKSFLLCHNGGWLYGGVVRLFGVGEGQYNIVKENAGLLSTAHWPVNLVGIATDSGLGLFGYDRTTRRDDGEYRIYYWSYEERIPEPVAESFEGWLGYLEELARIRLGPNN